MMRTADIVIVGAGIAGVSAAYHLAVEHDFKDVAVVDPRHPLTLTSDKSTECYRNWWPDRPMADLMNRSIDLFEELADEIDYGLNQRGYLFVTGDRQNFYQLADHEIRARELGVRADLLDAEDLKTHYGYITDDAVGAVRVGRAGWFRAQDLGRWLLDRARDDGVELVNASVTSIDAGTIGLSDGTSVAAPTVVIAAGPSSKDVASLAEIDLPLFSELHLKVAFKDHLGVIPRDAPMTIWSDTQTIDWTDEERAELKSLGREELLGEMPASCHFRPEGGPDSSYILALWEYRRLVMEPTWPIPDDPLYPEIVMRGLATMVPGLQAYRDRLPESHVDGGYYTKTGENRPLVGPSGVEGIHLLVGLSGFGVMASAGAADLLSRHIAGEELPDYSDAFLLSRYENPGYLAEIDSGASGQL